MSAKSPGVSGEKPRRVAGYARYSTAKQDQGLSIESQDKEMRDLSVRRGWTYVKTYADLHVSGGVPVDGRPALKELLEDAQAGAFDVVLAFDVTRLARDQVIFWDVIKRLRLAKVPFTTSIMPDISSDTPEFEMLAGSLQGAGSYERALVGKKVRIAHTILKAQGRHMGRPSVGFPIGEDGRLTPNAIGKRVLALLAEDPDISASRVRKEVPEIKNYKQAWNVLTFSKKYLAIVNGHGATST